MKHCKSMLAPLALVIACITFPGTGAAEGKHSVKGGVFWNPVGTVLTASYEHALNRRLSVGGLVGTLDYDYDDGSYNEEGDGSGFEALVRFRVSGSDTTTSFIVGGGIGLWDIDWTWSDPNDFPGSGRGTTDSVNAYVTAGWRIPLTAPFYFEPSLIVGNWGGDSNDSTGTQETELGVYVAAGLSVGARF